MLRPGTDKTWLEPVLRRQLERVAAPDDLWRRTMFPPAPEGRRPRHRRGWLVAAAAAFTISMLALAWGYHPGRSHGTDLSAGRAANRGELVSRDAGEIRTWIRVRTGLDIPLLSHPPASIEMIGASVADSGVPAVEVRFRAANQEIVLQVSRSGVELPGDANENAATTSWVMAGQAYTLTARNAHGLEGACLACHADRSL